jgi:hypothetical protein
MTATSVIFIRQSVKASGNWADAFRSALRVFLGCLIGVVVWPRCASGISDDVPGLEVKAAVFTNAIEQKNFVEPGMQSGLRIQHGPIYFWTVLTGTEETLNALRLKTKSFPIWHRWTYIGTFGFMPEIAEVADRDTEAIHIGTIHHWPALLSEVVSAGKFDWRTWSGKKHLRMGRYQVTVMCGKNKALQCNGQECTYYFDYFP